jgi:hypothetical protein
MLWFFSSSPSYPHMVRCGVWWLTVPMAIAACSFLLLVPFSREPPIQISNFIMRYTFRQANSKLENFVSAKSRMKVKKGSTAKSK